MFGRFQLATHSKHDILTIYQALGFLYDTVGQVDRIDLAFGREVAEYRCAAIVEAPDDFDWATAIARQFFCDHFDRIRLSRLARSCHKPLSELATCSAACIRRISRAFRAALPSAATDSPCPSAR